MENGRPFRRRLLWALIAVLGAICILGIAVSLDCVGHKSARQELTLSNGTKLRLQAVLGGTEYIYSTKGLRDRIADSLSWLPFASSLRSPDGYYQERFRNSGPAVSVLFEPDGPLPSGQRVRLADESGWATEIGSTHYMYAERYTGATPPPLVYYTSSVSPRTRQLTLSIIQPSYGLSAKEKELGSFHFANPLQKMNYVPLKGTKLPAQASDAQLSVTLLRLVTNVDREWPYSVGLGRKLRAGEMAALTPAANQSSNPMTWLAFQVQEGDRITTACHVDSFLGIDALGTQLRASSTINREHADFNSFAAEPSLWSDCGAFQLQIDLVRWTEFPPDDLWTFDVDVPSTATFRAESRSHGNGSSEFYLAGVGGPGAYSPNHGCTALGILLDFEVPENTTETRRLQLVKAVDNFGRQLNESVRCGGGYGKGAGSNLEFQSFGLGWRNRMQSEKIPESAVPTSITVTMAFTRTRRFEFIAEPEVAKK